MDNEIICPSCAIPIQVPSDWTGAFLVCPHCGVPIDIADDGTIRESYLN